VKPTRRTVLGLAYAASIAAAAGCGLRLDLPQPAPPVPTRRLVPDEKLLVGVVRELDELVAGAKAITRAGRSAATLATLATLFSDQARVVAGRLTNDGVPSEVIRPRGGTASGTPTASGTTVPTTVPTTGPKPAQTVAAYVEQLEAVDSGHWAEVAASTPDNRELLMSLASVRLAGSLLLGGKLPFGPPAAARPHLAERTAPLVYGFEVVAAQSSGVARTRALTALEEATDLLHALGATSSETPGGWSLPFPVTTLKEASRLAKHLLGTAVAATVIEADRTPDARSLDEIARWSARVQVLAARWGLPLTAFPGMST
jgi:hypothetical protein